MNRKKQSAPYGGRHKMLRRSQVKRKPSLKTIIAPPIKKLSLKPGAVKPVALPVKAQKKIPKPGPETPTENPISPIEWKHSDFSDIVKIGAGGYAKVFKAYRKPGKTTYALKVMNRTDSFSKAELDGILLEYSLQEKANHSNIAQYLGRYFHEERHIFIMNYYSRGNLHSLICKGHDRDQANILTPVRARMFTRQIISAVMYIQSKLGYIHKDLKPLNILIADENCVKVTDFGCAVKMKSYRYVHPISKERCGTPSYFPSEQFENSGFDSTVDVWAIAFIAFEMLTREKPYAISPQEKLRWCDLQERVKGMEMGHFPNFKYYQLQNQNQEAYEFFRQVFVQRLHRPLIHEMEALPWLNSADGDE